MTPPLDTWLNRKLPEVLDFQEGPGIMARDFRQEGVPLIRLAGLKRGAPLLAGCDFLDEKQVSQRWDHFRLQRGDVLLSTSASLGEIATVDESGVGAIPYTGIIRFRPKAHEVLSQFIPYALRAPSFKRQVEAMGVGSVIKHFGPTHLRQMTVLLPPARVQQAVTEVLDALDDKISVNERIARTSLALAKARTEAAATAEPVRLGDITEVFDGPHATPTKTLEGPWFLSISSLKGGLLDLAESAHLSEEDFPRWTRRVQPSEGDVLFSYETRLGEAALMPPGVRASLGRRMGLLRPKSTSVSSALLLHSFLSPPFQVEIRRRTVHGATVDRIPLKDMPAWPITLPTEDVRPRLSAALEALHASINQVAVENRTLADLRDTLLPQLVTGKIRVKDAERAVEDATS
ncbi:restriction endonuclease subunit S [Streptomyces africanus]|uniref:restriction endonuclease subunit S n=1 Tax=Streptomyces africanus TaxID=231024 RepID=UPI000A3B7ABC|nr:restriction endonuclease subunit S [Streptomyces africanus]